jgi:methylamine dehydrogenase light chain
MKKFDADAMGEKLLRKFAGHTSRRSMLSRLGLSLAAAPAFPLLPVGRADAQTYNKTDRGIEARTHFAHNAQTSDDTKCDYWRFCGIDGLLCTCSGGGIHTCPAGAEPSTVSWVGTCLNPDDNKAYLIAYRDCCGKPSSGQCRCDGTDRETQIYVPATNNNIIWCFGVPNMEYHCSTAVLVGPAQ